MIYTRKFLKKVKNQDFNSTHCFCRSSQAQATPH